jgi:predicted transcriptional regulator
MFESEKKMRILANPIAWKILESISEKPKYAAQISKELNIYEQSAYYYIRKLISIGAIREYGTDFVRGGTAKLYECSSPSFGIEMPWGEKRSTKRNIESKINQANHVNNTIAKKFLKEFINNENLFDGLVIVGSPNPHGIFKTSARDGHYAIQLAFFLGNICNLPESFIVKLDEDAKAEKELEDNNLIIIGGPGTNIVSAEFNRYLPIKFNDTNYWSGLVDSEGKLYHLDNLGIIAKIKNPFNKSKNIILIAGVRSIGTKSAVIAFTNFSKKMFNEYTGNEDQFGAIVQGYDMNSDGKIDYVDIEKVIKT